MATRKRVRAFPYTPPRRAPDGSAFIKCDECGVSVAVALMDMHDCNKKKDVKKFKGNSNPSTKINSKKNCISEQPRSPFMFFMESYSKSCKGQDLVESSREAVENWKKMSFTERWPYIFEAQKVEDAYLKVLRKEEIQVSKENDDEAQSANCTQNDDFVDSEDYCSEDEDEDEDKGWNTWKCPLRHQSCFYYEQIEKRNFFS